MRISFVACAAAIRRTALPLLILLSALGVNPGNAQTYSTLTIAPTPTASAVGQLRFAEKSNSAARHLLSFEGPDTLGANVRYKWAGSTTAGCLSLGAVSGGINTITSGACTSFPIVFPSGTAAPQLDATGLGDALNINGSTTVNGDIVFNPGNVTGLSSVQINGHNNSVTSTQTLILNEVTGLGGGISMLHGGTFDAAWQAGSSAAFDVVSNNGSSHRFVILQNGLTLVARTSDDGSGAIFQVNGNQSINGNILPLTNNTQVLGGASNRWNTAYAGTYDASVGFASVNTASNTVNIPNGGILATNGTFGVSPNYIVIQKTAPQLDASSLGAAFNFNGASATNGNIVFNPGNVTGLSSVQINGHNNSTTSTQTLILNEVTGLGGGVSVKHGGTFDAAWQAGSSAAFDVVGNDASTHRFVILHDGKTLVARTSDDGSGAIFQVSGDESLSGKVIRYNGATTVGMGVAPVYDSVDLTGQTASIGLTALHVNGGVAPAGLYRINLYVSCRSAGTGSVIAAARSNNGVNTHDFGVSSGLTATTQADAMSTTFYTDGSADITYYTTYTATGSYDLHIAMERID